MYFENNQDKCVILDEIQRMPYLFPILIYMIDQNRVQGRYILLGSATLNLIRNSSESLAGRIAYKELTPFNITELNIYKDKILNDHWFKGGFPDAYLAPTDILTNKWHYNFIKTF